jgi:hypothetical protein
MGFVRHYYLLFVLALARITDKFVAILEGTSTFCKILVAVVKIQALPTFLVNLTTATW